MNMRSILAVLSFLWAICLYAQTDAEKSSQAQRMEITLEKQEGNAWKPMDPGFVFTKGDHIRFRFRASFNGYLYAMDYGTSGSYTLLFPREETGTDNGIVAGKEYQIPATSTLFRIDGPPGHDIVYWMVSPILLWNPDAGAHPAVLPKPKQPPKTLMPRCDDSIWRARGDCIDSSAGLRSIPDSDDLPENLQNVPRAKARELFIMRKEDSSLVSSPVPLTGPVIYQFRLAHK
jgi:hypothetical protein